LSVIVESLRGSERLLQVHIHPLRCIWKTRKVLLGILGGPHSKFLSFNILEPDN
jgi:hypothetical protein